MSMATQNEKDHIYTTGIVSALCHMLSCICTLICPAPAHVCYPQQMALFREAAEPWEGGVDAWAARGSLCRILLSAWFPVSSLAS